MSLVNVAGTVVIATVKEMKTTMHWSLIRGKKTAALGDELIEEHQLGDPADDTGQTTVSIHGLLCERPPSFFQMHYCQASWILCLIGSIISFCLRDMLHILAHDDHGVSRKVVSLRHVP